MRCPRCYTRISDEETNCVDCGLPKPKRPVTSEQVAAPAEEVAAAAAEASQTLDELDKLNRPRPIYSAKINSSKTLPQQQSKTAPKSTRTAPQKDARPRRGVNRTVLLVGVPIMLSALAAVIYLYVIPALQPEKMEPQTAIMALNRLRRMPSNEEGVNVHDRVMQEVDKSRKVGKLKGYQGWTVNPVEGDKSKVVVVFTFDEYNSQQRAEWLADLVNNTYTPRTELAAAIYKREPKK